MSAIYGIVYKTGQMISNHLATSIMAGFDQFSFDKTGTWQDDSVFFGCRLQWVTPESEWEQLPYVDLRANLTITADAIIDNRAELFDLLAIPYDRRKGMSDSQLILLAYQKWGEACPEYLAGDFAFTVWDRHKQTLFCARDHTGNRTLYYYHDDTVFAFATLIKPLFSVPEIAARKKLNELWLADFLANPTVGHQLDPELTIYEPVVQLAPGTSLTLTQQGFRKREYWRVEKLSELRLKSDAEYEEAFRAVLLEAVHCRMRSIKPVGVMMSGGLDSTSVACMAAAELRKTGQRLKVFSALPLQEYADYLPPSRVADESEYIEAVRKYTGNIDVFYDRSEGRHSLSDVERFLALLEQPYKIVENLFWLNQLTELAGREGIGILLNGQMGNVTISWGNAGVYQASLLRQGHWRQLVREVYAYSRASDVNPLRRLAGAAFTQLPRELRIVINRHIHKTNGRAYKSLSLLNPKLAKQVGMEQRMQRFGLDPYFLVVSDSVEERKKLLNLRAFNHLGVITTKRSLGSGVVSRDPTADKRLIDFCLQVPENQWVRGGNERYLLRRAMQRILPDKVRLNNTERGKQSADFVQRLMPIWQDLVQEAASIRDCPLCRYYLDMMKIEENIRIIGNKPLLYQRDEKNAGIRLLVRAIICKRFLAAEG